MAHGLTSSGLPKAATRTQEEKQNQASKKKETAKKKKKKKKKKKRSPTGHAAEPCPLYRSSSRTVADRVRRVGCRDVSPQLVGSMAGAFQEVIRPEGFLAIWLHAMVISTLDMKCKLKHNST